MAKLAEDLRSMIERGAYNFARMRAVIAPPESKAGTSSRSWLHPDPMQLIPPAPLRTPAPLPARTPTSYKRRANQTWVVTYRPGCHQRQRCQPRFSGSCHACAIVVISATRPSPGGLLLRVSSHGRRRRSSWTRRRMCLGRFFNPAPSLAPDRQRTSVPPMSLLWAKTSTRTRGRPRVLDLLSRTLSGRCGGPCDGSGSATPSHFRCRLDLRER